MKYPLTIFIMLFYTICASTGHNDQKIGLSHFTYTPPKVWCQQPVPLTVPMTTCLLTMPNGWSTRRTEPQSRPEVVLSIMNVSSE